MMSMGSGAIVGVSKKQKLNTKSSTECELVGVDDVMPQVLWTRYFIEAQGYKVSEAVVYQDNQSAILLEKNGKESSGKKTKHIRVRYFFVKDRISQGDITVKHCPSEKMWGDHFSKPTQGQAYRKMRARVQGVPEEMTDADMSWDQSKEIDK
jgi:hypothetical protein